MTEPLTQAELGRLRRAIETDTLTGYPVEKVALIESALHYEACLREVEAGARALTVALEDTTEDLHKAEADVAFRDEAIKNLGAEIKRLQARPL